MIEPISTFNYMKLRKFVYFKVNRRCKHPRLSDMACAAKNFTFRENEWDTHTFASREEMEEALD
jgi:hypothetical protein